MPKSNNKRGGTPAALVLLGVLLIYIGSAANGNGDITAIGTVLFIAGLVAIFARGLRKEESSSSKPGSYNYAGKSFQTRREMERYRDDYREAARRNDPRFR